MLHTEVCLHGHQHQGFATTFKLSVSSVFLVSVLAATCSLYAGCTKKDPVVVGKPAEFMLANIAEAFGMERHQICMVGDRLDTDILFGQDGGLSTMLVLSGMLPLLCMPA